MTPEQAPNKVTWLRLKGMEAFWAREESVVAWGTPRDDAQKWYEKERDKHLHEWETMLSVNTKDEGR